MDATKTNQQGSLPFYAVEAEAVAAELESSPRGLSQAERAHRLADSGPNAMPGRKPEPWWKEFLEAFTEPLQLLLIAVAVLSGIFGELTDAIAVGTLILVVAVVETTTELRAKRAIQSLREMTAPTARVLVDGTVTTVAAADVVPGDILILESGDIVAADARILNARGLKADESAFTGEAQAASKSADAVSAEAPLAERSSIVFAGTAVVAGEGKAVVARTAADTELGQMGLLVSTSREPATPLQRGMAQLAKWVLVAALAASILVPIVGLLTGHPWQEMVLTGLTVAFATVPEELPILVTVLLAVGSRQMAKQGALVRRLRAVESIGSITAILTDKTGTLTQNRLRLERVYGNKADVLNVGLHTQVPGIESTEPIESEIRTHAINAGLNVNGRELFAVPFDPSRRRASRAWVTDDGIEWLAVSGAPEAVLDLCVFDDAERVGQEAEAASMARDGLRVIAYARKKLPAGALQGPEAETGLEFVGLAGFQDPLREGVPEAVATLSGAGVKTLMVTGDHPDTAAAIAKQSGMTPQVITGPEFDALDDAEATAKLNHGTVIARATPTTKHRAVRLMQAQGHVVAVTGDGANDAPALAAADVGIALGKSGTQLAREAAGMVLTDDSYPTVVSAVAKGRNITAQLRRAVAFYLGAKLALVAVMLLALAVGLPTPFQPQHIILLEVFMDLGASVAFVSEPSAPRTMERPPRRPGASFLDGSFFRDFLTVALTLFLATAATYWLLGPAGDSGVTGDPGVARTGAVLAWLAAHAVIAWTLRTRPGLSWRANPAFPLWAAAAIIAGLVLAATPLGTALGFTLLDANQLGTAILCAAVAALCAIVLRFVWPEPNRTDIALKA